MKYIPRKIIKTLRGFTLIELLLYIGIFSILLGVLLQLFFSIIDVNLQAETTSAVSNDGRYILSRIAYDMHQAQSIVQPASLGAQGNTLQINRLDGTNLTYSLSGGNLMLTNNTAGYQDVLNSVETQVSNLSFTRLGITNGEQTITISFTVNSVGVIRNNAKTQTFQTTIGDR